MCVFKMLESQIIGCVYVQNVRYDFWICGPNNRGLLICINLKNECYESFKK